MNREELRYFKQLGDAGISEGDQVNCMEMLEVLLVVEAVESLIGVVRDESRTKDVRRAAAHAVYTLCGSKPRPEVIELSQSSDSDLKELARIALTGGDDEKPGGAWNPHGTRMNMGGEVFIQRLKDRSLSVADQESCVEALEVLLEVESVGLLIDIMKDGSRDMTVRLAAAGALHTLAPEGEKANLLKESHRYSSELKGLCHIVIHGRDHAD